MDMTQPASATLVSDAQVEGLAHNPASDLDVVALPKPAVAHNPFLRMDELPALLATPDQFDLERRLWIIPPEVVKQL